MRPGWLLIGLLAGAAPAEAAQPPAPAIFEDVTEVTGLRFTYAAGRSTDVHLPEIMGAGAAVFDFDGDGDLDVFLVQAGGLGPRGEPRGAASSDRLFRNDLVIEPDGRRRLRFTDVSASSGLVPGGYGMGVAAGDLDGDGWVDLVVTGYGSLRLLRNIAGRRFEDVSAGSGLDDDGLSVSAAILDADGDGRLDVFVVRYMEYSPVRCTLPSGRPDYCGPKSYPSQRDRLFRNLGGLRFEDASRLLPGPSRTGSGLGIVAADLDDDGFTDAYVANDGSDNHLWLNQRGRGFREDGLIAGVALNRSGQAEAGMGVDAGDVDGDGDLDLFVTNLTGETNTLYENLGGGLFEDQTIERGLAVPSLPWTGFGTRFLDYDNDGALDLVVVNGAVHLPDEPLAPGVTPLGEPKQLYRNLGSGRFADVSAEAGAAFARLETSRGLAVGDLDDDGDPDLVVANNDEPARVLLNTRGQDAPWLGLRLVDAGGREALHARATLRRRGAADLVRHVHGDGSYASSSDTRLLFGLSGGSELVSVDVGWPDGSRESFDPPALGRYTTLRRGSGRPAEAGR